MTNTHALNACLADVVALLHPSCAILRVDARDSGPVLLCHGEHPPDDLPSQADAPTTLRDHWTPLDSAEHPEVAAALRPAGFQHGLGAPIRSGTGAFLGELWVLSTIPRTYTAAERHALTLFATELGRELDRARIEEDDLAALGTEDSRYAAIFEAMAEGVVVQARDGRILAANRAAERILRMTADELRGRSSLDPEWRSIRGDGSPFPGVDHPAMVTLRTGQRQENVLMGVRRGSDTPTWISINSVPLFHAGTSAPYAVVCSFADITALKEAEERLATAASQYRRIFEQSPDGLLLLNDRGVVIDANPPACALLGRGADLLRGAHRRDLVDPEDPDIARYIDIGARTGASRGPLRWRRADGTLLHSEHSAVVLRGADQRPFTVLSFRDAEGERRIERAKRDFLATVSHELRTPLTSIRGALGLLVAGVFGGLSADGLALAAAATDDANRLARLVSDLLDSSAMDAGSYTIAPARFSLEALLAESAAATAALVDAAGLVVQTRVDRDDDAYGDRFRLQQVLINLISNAAKFSEPEAVIAVVAKPGAHAGTRVEVLDRGPGVAEDDRARIFQRFVQLDASDARRRGGAGLGLAIARAIIDAHGGSIGVDAREGGGSVFWFEIPGAPAPA